MVVPSIPSELIDQIVDAVWEVTSAGVTVPTSRKALKNLSYVSRSFYTSARRRLWTRLSVSYEPPPARWSAKNDILYEILSQNPSLTTDVRDVWVSITVTNTHPALVKPKRGTNTARSRRSAIPDALAKALCLLSNTGNIRSLGIFLSLGITRVRILDPERSGFSACEDNVLFALTALRTSPSLRKLSFQYAHIPPLALLFGHPRFDAIETISLSRVTFPPTPTTTPTFRDYSISQDAALSLHLSEDGYHVIVQAIKYFLSNPTPHAQFPLLPKTKRIAVSICREKITFIPYILQQPPIDASKALRGHLLSLESLEYDDILPGIDMIAVRLNLNRDLRHTASQLKHLHLVGQGSCNALDSSISLDKLECLTLQIISMELDPLYDPTPSNLARTILVPEHDETLSAILRVLNIISPSNFPSLKAIFVEMFIGANMPVEEHMPYLFPGYQGKDGLPLECWSLLDTSFVNLCARLAPLRDRVDIRLKLSITFPDASWEATPVHEKALRDAGICPDNLLDLFPKSKVDDAVCLEVVFEADDAC